MEKTLKTIRINGLDCVFAPPFSVLQLMNYIGFNKNVIVIDYNGLILESNLWKTTLLKNNDSLEIVAMAGGG